MLKRALTAMIIGVLLLASGLYVYHAVLLPVNPDVPAELLVIIEKGTTVKTVAQMLARQGLIRNRLVFSEYLKLKGLDRKITAGRFRLSPSLSVPEIAQRLTAPRRERIAITIPPGVTLKQINEIIVSLGLAAPEELSAYLTDKNLEGYLFPDTYFADAVSFTPQSFFAQLLENFETKTALLRKEATRTGQDWHAIVTLASIVEREIKTPEDLAPVAGILWKRLKAGWPLGADATLLYDDSDGVLSVADLQRGSPYNTRIRPGLPPTPISNPGLTTLQAVLEPKETPYWFYITELTEGKVIYAKTHAEHERNVARYLH